VCVTVRLVTVFVTGAVVSAAGSELVSTVDGAVSGAGVGVGAGAGVTAVDGSVVTGCVCCASNGVDESAKAAAIAGRALVRASFVAFLIMRKNRYAGTSVATLSPARAITATDRLYR